MGTAASQVREEPALIDQEIVDRYCKRGPRMIGMLIDAFLQEAPKYFQDIRSGLDAQDYSIVRVSAHGLKSCSFNLGAVRLAEICQDIEDKASRGTDSEVEASVQLVGPTLFDTEEALKSLKLSVQADQP